jgi:hypothetical protein
MTLWPSKFLGCKNEVNVFNLPTHRLRGFANSPFPLASQTEQQDKIFNVN